MFDATNRYSKRSPLARCTQVVGLATLATTLLIAPGCKRWNWNWRGQGYGDASREWGDTTKMRPPADPSKFSGFDERARDIERNLGVR